MRIEIKQVTDYLPGAVREGFLAESLGLKEHHHFGILPGDYITTPSDPNALGVTIYFGFNAMYLHPHEFEVIKE